MYKILQSFQVSSFDVNLTLLSLNIYTKYWTKYISVQFETNTETTDYVLEGIHVMRWLE